MLREESSDSVTTISIDRSELLVRLRECVSSMARDTAAVVAVRLLGSLARNSECGTSDVDLLVLLNETPVDRVEWIRRLLGYFDLPVGVDLLVYGAREFEEGIETGNVAFRRMWGESKPL
ncbi:MAG: nucleotidyltransferase domain-containing protein [Acidobacteriota bacterium]|jgi:predicted nucleotidyltransferase